MPKIPVRKRVGPGQVRAVRADAGGAAMTQLGRQVSELGLRMEKARQSRETNEVVTEATRQILAHEDDLKTRPDEFASWEEQHSTLLTDTREELSATIEDQVVRDAVTQRLNTVQLHSEVRVRQGARGMEIKEGRAAISAMGDVLSDNYAKSRSNADRQMFIDGFEDAVDEAAANGILTPEEAVTSLRSFTNQSEKLRAMFDIEEDPDAALVLIEGDKYDIAPDDKLILKERADREIARNLAAQRAENARRQQLVQTSLYDGIQSGDVGRADLDKAYNTFDPDTNQRQVSEPGYRALLGQLNTYEKDQAKLNKAFDTYQNSISTGEALDYKIKDDREAAEAGFLRLVPKLADLEPHEKNTLIINDLRTTKIWPKSLQSQMRVAAKSTDLKTIENFSNLYDRVSTDKSVSAVNKSMVPEDQAYWESVGSLKRAGMFSKEAIELAKHNAFELTDDDRAALKQRYKAKKYVGGNADTLNALVQKSFSPRSAEFDKILAGEFAGINWSDLIEGAPDIPPGMAADYQNLVRKFFDFTGGDIELSRKLADENLERAWFSEEIPDVP